MRSIAVLVSFLLFAPSVSGAPGKAWQQRLQQPPPTQAVSWEPAQLVNGSPCLFRVRPAKQLASLAGAWLGNKVFFNFDPASGTWYGVAGVSVETAAGNYQLTLEGIDPSGERTSFSHTVPISKASYRTIALSVPRKYTEPDAETLARIKQEKALKSEVFGRTSAERQWSGRFIAPVGAVTSESFGTQRTFNGVRQSVHQGLD
jgi:hypothetical protein